MAIEGHSELGAAEVEASLERIDDQALLWRVATFEFDLAHDVVYWFDDPKHALNLSEERAAFVLEPILISVRGGTPWAHFDLEQTVEDLAGDPADLRVQARLLHGSSGAVAGAVGIVTDVSDQHRTEQALRGVVDRYRRLVELNPDPVVVHQEGVIRYVSPAALEMAGVAQPEEWVGRHLLEFIHPTSVEDTIQRIASLTEPGKVSPPAEVLLIAPDGTPKPYESISVCIEWDGRPAHQVILRSLSERRRAEVALRYQASLIAHVSDAVVAADLDGNIRGWNPAAEALYGHRAADVMGMPVGVVLGADAATEDGVTRSGEAEHQRADGSVLRVQVSVSPLRDELGQLSGTVAMCTDLTQRLERAAAEARYRAVVAALDEGVIVVDGDDTIVSVNASAGRILGSAIEVGGSARELIEAWPMFTEGGTILAPDEHPVSVAQRTGKAKSGVLGVRTSTGTRWFSLSAQPLAAGRNRTDGVVCSFSEITARKQIDEELNFQATHDPLTRLPARDLVLARLNGATGTTSSETGAALLLVDLDRFKAVNDTFGHEVGDRVLQGVAGRIAAAVGDRGELGRLAGDEFVIVCPATSDGNTSARHLAEQVIEAIRTPLHLPSGREVVVSASIGIAYCGSAQSHPEVVLSRADLAMYQAKKRGRARIEVFDDQLRATAERRLLLHEGLREAIDGDKLTVHYQPIVNADDLAIVGVEALARWEHPTLGKIGPNEFIPVAEETGLMSELGRDILEQACSDVARWTRRRQCPPDLALSVNISPRQLGDLGLVSGIRATLDANELEASRLWLEVTESVLMEDADESTAALSELRAAGVHIAIDDFGTGYSSLSYLKRFPAEALKIDQSFVEGLTSDPESEAIVVAIIGLAKSLNLRAIAEGVETPEQLARLRELGCHLLQGNFLSPPKPATGRGFRSDFS